MSQLTQIKPELGELVSSGTPQVETEPLGLINLGQHIKQWNPIIQDISQEQNKEIHTKHHQTHRILLDFTVAHQYELEYHLQPSSSEKFTASSNRPQGPS